MHKIFSMPFARVYPLYLIKVEKKGRTKAELDQVLTWLTGMSEAQLQKHIYAATTFTELFEAARLHENADQISGVICGVRIEEIQDPLMKKIRYMDKLVDELAKGRTMEKILRTK
jgi:hypothetical protein